MCNFNLLSSSTIYNQNALIMKIKCKIAIKMLTLFFNKTIATELRAYST